MVNEEHVSVCEAETVKMLTIEPGADLSTPEMRRTAIETLEGGGVIYLPRSGFELTEQERELISDTAKILTQEPDVQDGRPDNHLRSGARQHQEISLRASARQDDAGQGQRYGAS